MPQIDARVKQLTAQSKTGSQIAKTLREEGYSLEKAKNALFKAGFTIHQCRKYRGNIGFYVSDRPLSPAQAIATLFAKPRSLTRVNWNLD